MTDEEHARVLRLMDESFERGLSASKTLFVLWALALVGAFVAGHWLGAP